MMINFGIDLGTTNSVIARYHEGNVEVFKNPIGHKETLPSVVAFRNERILIGDKAREYLEKDPGNVFGSFKRKMGTDASYWVESISETRTPVDLSTMILKELRNFIYTGESPDAMVITIPASFDTIQSNATKQAGYNAGFREVLLLQEPIAASLAFVNKTSQQDDRKWLVYDLGGGTFDVALVETQLGEMKILDHEGDNFLGGLDFDNLIINRIIIPYLNTLGPFDNLEKELYSSASKYNKLYYILQKKAEEVKVTLSSAQSAPIEFEIELPDGTWKDVYFEITRTQFEDAIRQLVMKTIDIVRTVLERNTLQRDDLDCILLVGGSTYIPCVREWISQHLNIPVSTSIDPTTAIAVGAAYFAGTKKKQVTATPTVNTNSHNITVKTGYAKVSQDIEEYFVAEVTGDVKDIKYRIIRTDGGFDTGLRDLAARITEYLPLVPNTNNQFELRLFDSQQQLIYQDASINIVNGKYGILGQPLPYDICIEVDDEKNNSTRLEVVFARNAILPLKKTLTRSLSKTIRRGSDDSLIINVLEGSQGAMPSANLSIGIIEIKGRDITMDLVKGSDVEIALEMSESRDLRISTYLMMSDQEFTNLFTPSARQVNIGKMLDEISGLRHTFRQEIRAAETREEYETSYQLNSLLSDLDTVYSELKMLPDDDVTDRRYQLDDRKKLIAGQLDAFTKDKRKMVAKMEYFNTRNNATSILDQYGTEDERTRFKNLLVNEKQTLAADSVPIIESLTTKIRAIVNPVYFRTPEYLISIYHYYADHEGYPDPHAAAALKERGERALANSNYEELKVVINRLYALLPREEQAKANIRGTGIS